MAQPASRSERCNNNNNLNRSLHDPHCNQGDLFPFPGFTTNNKSDAEDYTPIAKIPSGSVPKSANSAKSTEENSSNATPKTPPVEPSVSPEIQSNLCRSVLVSGAAPSTCYGAGHVISGVIDKRKCKARGILSAGHSNHISYDKSEQDMFKKSSPSLIPFPAEASISWYLSPSYVDNNGVDEKGDYPKGLHKSWKIFESATNSIPSPLQEERISSFDEDHEGKCSPFSPFSADSLSSGNVIQTPNSDSSLERHVSSSWLNEGIHLKQKFESELDQLTNVLEHESLSPWDPPRLSSDLSDSSPSSNLANPSHLRENTDTHASWVSENMSESHMRISWKDDLDCCRLLSDEEIDADGLLKSPRVLDHDGNKSNNKETSFPNPCAESISTDDGGLTASGDSDWTHYYKNHSFEI